MHGTVQRKQVDKLFSPALMGLLALGVVPLLLLDLSGKLTPTGSIVVSTLDWLVISIFGAEYIARLATAESKLSYMVSPWSLLDLVIVVAPFAGVAIGFFMGTTNGAFSATPMLRLLRVGRIAALGGKSLQELRLHRTLVKNHFYQVAAGVLVLFLGMSSAFFVVENSSFRPLTYADTLWWGWGALSPIGSEVIPSTGMGRVLGTTLMILGLAFAGFFTANVVSYFQEPHGSEKQRAEKDDKSISSSGEPLSLRDLLERQQTIEAKLDQLLAQKDNEAERGLHRK